MVTTCLYGQSNGWPASFGVGASVPSKGTYGTLNLCVELSGENIGRVLIGVGDSWIELQKKA